MDLTEKAGQPSMEEILASIRRIIAEEPADAIFLSPKSSVAAAHTTAANEPEDGAEFQLPSMFRPSSPQISENANTAPVRLTDALRLASVASDAELKSNGSAEIGAYAALSSLKPLVSPLATTISPIAAPQPAASTPTVAVKAEAPAPVSAPVLLPADHIPAPFAPAPVATEAPVVRKMASFSDSRFKSISNSPVVPMTEPAATLPVKAVTMAEPVQSTNNALTVQQAFVSPPTTPLQPAAEANVSSGVEDQTAELLRPMLRQWLTENMPRMVEKALFMEVNTTNNPKKD